jgi:hypothetical protein
MTVAERLGETRSAEPVGREAVLSRLVAVAESGRSAVVFVQGSGGVGKSTVLYHFTARMRASGRTVVAVDLTAIEPTLSGIEAAAREATEARAPVMLTLDAFERFAGRIDGLRDRLLPRLPSGTLVVIAGRNPPDLTWQLDAAWSAAFHHVVLRELDPPAAEALLASLNVAPSQRAAIRSFAGGNPLGLSLAAAQAHTAAAQANTAEQDTTGWAPTPGLLATLLDRLLGEAPGPGRRRALEVCALAPHTTEDLLREIVGPSAAELFQWLRQRPYIDATPLGLRPHELVRGALEADLRWRAPKVYRQIHEQLLQHLLNRVRTAIGQAVTPAVSALNRVLWRGGDEGWSASPATPADHDVIRRLAGGTDGPLVDYWLARQPESFEVLRRPAGHEPVSYLAYLRLTERDDAEIRADPVLAEVWRQVGTAPLRPGETVGVARFAHPMTAGRPAAVTALVAVRELTEWLRGPEEAWSFVTVPENDPDGPQLKLADHHPLDRPAVVGGRRFLIYGHDWRTVPRAAWVSRVSRYAMVGGPPAGPSGPAPIAVPLHADFAASVRDALRQWHRPAALAGNPLLRVRLVADRASDQRPAADVLRELLTEAIDSLRRDPRERKLFRVLTATYVNRASSQDAAAESLGLPFSTYRRHLNQGIERVTGYLWQRETT